MRISNHADHILSLGRTSRLAGTIVILESSDGTKFSLFSAESWIQDLKRRIREYYSNAYGDAFKEYRAREERRLEDRLKALDKSYVQDYDEYVGEHRLYAVLSLVNPFWWTGVVLAAISDNPAAGVKTFSPPLDESLAPKSVKESMREEHGKGMELLIESEIAQLDQHRASCLERAESVSMRDDLPMILSGTYPQIVVLPLRDTFVYVPFEQEAEYPESLRLQIFDLPTKLNQAGVATRRSNFSFTLERLSSP